MPGRCYEREREGASGTRALAAISVDSVTYGGLDPELDRNILNDAMLV